MSEQNKTVTRRLIDEVWNMGNFAVVDELIARDYVGHSSVDTHGPEGYKQFYATQRSAFPDIHYTVEDMPAERDKVVTRWTARATHTGEFHGIPSTGSWLRAVRLWATRRHRYSSGSWVARCILLN